MKIHFDKDRRKFGSILIATLLLAMILGITLGSYLYWVRTQNVLIAQSQSWNSALALAEAGIEDGMAQINVNVGAGDPTVVANYGPSTAANFGSLGSAIAGAYGPKPNNTLSNGWYSVIIIPPPNPSVILGPTIIATGYTTVPLISKPLVRTVQVTTTIKSLLANGITATTDVSLKGNGLTMDSYDSSDLLHFPGGYYNSSNRMAGGDVASLYGIIGIQNADIYGHVLTGATDTNTPSVGSNGRVGDLSWAGPGIQAGWWVKDFNMDVPDIGPPYSTGLGVTTGNGTNTWDLANGNFYVNGDFTINN